MNVIADRVRESSASTGANDFALAGAVAGFRSFFSQCPVGESFYYVIETQGPTGLASGEWEVGLGTLVDPATLDRLEVLASSNDDDFVNFQPGTKHVWIDVPAAQLLGFAPLVHQQPWSTVTGTPTTLAGYGITDGLTKATADSLYAPQTHVHAWSSITATPTTLAGYGITDALTKASADSLYSPIVHTHAWSAITGTPTTVAGYGITDAFTQAQGDARYALIAHQQPWSTITATPTTVAGYGITDALTLATADARYAALVHTQAWSTITATPTTIAGYGITDAYTKTQGDARYAPLAHTQAWATITATPTTISGYGITDAFTQAAADALYLTMAGNLAGLADLPTSRTNLALGAADSPTFATLNLTNSLSRVAGGWSALLDNSGLRIVSPSGQTPVIRLSQTTVTDFSITAPASIASTIAFTGVNTYDVRNGVNPETWRIYNTYTDAANYERLTIQAAATFSAITQEQAGTGAVRNMTIGPAGAGQMRFKTSNIDRWAFSALALLPLTDNTNDVGSNTLRVRDYYGIGRILSAGAGAGGIGGIGYTTGAGGTVAQASSKATTVILNTVCGQITMNNTTLNAGTIVSFQVTNSAVAATDLIVIQHVSVGTFGAYSINARAAAGSFTVDVRNNTAGNLGEAIVLGFAVIKGVTA